MNAPSDPLDQTPPEWWTPTMRTATLAALLLALAPASASAHHLHSPTLPEIRDTATTIAANLWPHSGCRDQTTVRADEETTAYLAEHGLDGLSASWPICAIWMPTDTSDPVQWCSTLIHEHGHLAGLQHSADRRSIMHHRAPDLDACKPLARPFHPLAAARQETQRRTGHHWTCRRRGRDLVRCEGEPRGQSRHDGLLTWQRDDDRWERKLTYQ